MPRTLLISIPGLSRELLAQVPVSSGLGILARSLGAAEVVPGFPAVTCTVQASMTTGVGPDLHGVVANGLATYRDVRDADLTDPANHVETRRLVSFWEQSNALLDAPRVWEGSGRKVAMLFFQQSMPPHPSTSPRADGARAPADIVVTPKPEHGPGGKLTSLLWTSPADLGARLQGELGPFPLMKYWGPMAGIESSAWICRAAARVWQTETPDLQLTYVPHLDYDLQRFGPTSAQAVKAVGDLATALDPLLEAAGGARIIIVGEYGIDPVDRAFQPNLTLLEAGFLKLTTREGGPAIDYAGSDAWVMCDHQIGHVFGPRAAEALDLLRRHGLEPARAITHRRSGLTVQAPKGAWLDYRWWPTLATTDRTTPAAPTAPIVPTAPAVHPSPAAPSASAAPAASDGPAASTSPVAPTASTTTDARIPAWARTVDIHSKPGYDPLELFFDPATRAIATDSTRIKGSHGRADGTRGVLLAEGVSGEVAVTDIARLLA